MTNHLPPTISIMTNNGHVGTVRELDNGFIIETTALPPYYMDFIADAHPYLDDPKWVYTNPAGDTFELEYEPPDVPPSQDADEEDYIMYLQWKSIQQYNRSASESRRRAKRDFLLAMCVNVIDGPHALDDTEWVDNLLAIGYEVPTAPGARKVAFLNALVMTSEEIWAAVSQDSLFLEVTVAGVYMAMAGLGLLWEGQPLAEVVAEKTPSALEHNVMLWEAETAEACGLPFDERWYNIPVNTREYMIAARLGRSWGSSLMDEAAAKKATRAIKKAGR